MGTLQFKNNASTTLSGSINNTQTTFTVVSGSGFPALTGSDYFYATMYELSGSTEINIEIVKVTGLVGNNWTVVRAQDGTTGRSRDGITPCYVELRMTAAGAQQMLQKDLNLSDLSDAAVARTSLGLGSLATQSASSVNITGGTISGVTFDSLDSQTTIKDNADPTKLFTFEVSGISTGTLRTLTVPNANGTIALVSDLTAGYQPLDSDLTAIAGLAANGLIARTANGSASVRSITAPVAGITVSNGDGVSGNPTLTLANDLAAVEALSTTGFVRRTGSETWSASTLVDSDLPSALTGKSYNGVTPTALTTGFSLAGGTTSKTLTVLNSITLAGTDGTTITLPNVSGTVPLNNQTFYVGTTALTINRASASQTLTGVSIDGSAGSATSATSATTSTNLASGVLGSVPYQSAASTTALLSPNTTTTKQFLSQTGTGTAGAAPAWSAVSKSDVGLGNVENTALSTWVGSTSLTTLGTIATGTWQGTAVGIAYGGTGAATATAAFNALSPSTTLGDLIYHDGTNDVRLAGNTTTNRRFLRQTGNGSASAAPAWDGLVDGDIPSALTGKTYNSLSLTAQSVGFTVAGGTTSKTLTVSNTLTLAGTDSSTLNIGAGGTLGSAAFTALTAYAPAAGSSSIVTVGTITSGTWTGSAIGISYGGTGQTSSSAGFNALSPVTTLGDLIYGNGANSNTRLAGNTSTTKQFLMQTGTGTVSAAPVWGGIADGDIPTALSGKTYNGLSLTANATGFSVAGGTTSKTLTVNNNLTLSGTDGSSLDIGAGGTLGSAAYTASTAYEPAITTLAATKGGTGSSSYAVGDILYANSTTTLARLSGNGQTSKLFLTQTGTGASSAAPVWAGVVNADIPTALTGKTYNGLTLTANTTGFQVAGGTTSKTLVVSNNLTFSGTDGSTLNIGGGGTLGTGAYATIANYAPLASPTFTGTPAAPTAAVDTNTTQLATTAYVIGQGYLKSATASSTYQTQAGMSSYLTTSSASSTYQTQSGMSSYAALAGINTFAPAARTGFTTAAYFTLTTPADTALTMGAEAIGSRFTAATRTWGGVGDVSIQRERLFDAPTYAFASGTNTISTAINVDIATPIAGTNATIAAAYALRAGASLFTSNVTIQGNVGLGTSILTGSAGHAFMPASGVLTSVGTSANFGNNVRYTTGWIANSTAASGLYSITGGQHDWYTAASVTAGSAVTLVKTLTLDTSGNLTATANVTAYSDERLKKDWEELPSDFIERLAQVKHGTYTRTDTGARQIGVGAQSLQPVAPEGVLDGEHLSVAYGNVALAAAVELAKRVVRLEAALRQLIGD